jgi:hypothetical protein
MQHKDALTIYEELLIAGVPEAQAKTQAHQYGDLSDNIGISLNNFERILGNMDKRLTKIDKDMWWMRGIGAGMIIACFGVMFK